MEVIDGQSIFGHADHKRVTRKLVSEAGISLSRPRAAHFNILCIPHSTAASK